MKKHLLPRRKKASGAGAGKSLLIAAIIMFSLSAQNLFAQKMPPGYADSSKTPMKQPYPKVVGYLSFIFPLETYSRGKFTGNFGEATSIGFPVGVNVLYSDKFGFSYEFTPIVKASGGASKMSNLLFDPGTMFRFQHGFTIISRLAFETSGRYGFTPVFNKVYARSRAVSYFVAVSLPTRFGNSAAASIGLNLQLGFTFN